MHLVEVFEDAVSNHASKHVGKRVPRIKPGNAAGQLWARIPRGHEEDAAREERGLCKA